MTWQELEIWLQTPVAARRPLIMGILNVTPDSFSDGGRFSDVSAAIARGRQLIDEGADLIDVGGESTRPGAQRVPADEQLRRVISVISALSDANTVLSIDTTRSQVAAEAIDAGARLVNDVSGGLDDPAMLSLVAAAGLPIVLMHNRGEPATMQSLAYYDDLVAEVRDHLRARRDAALAAGVAGYRILLDPGIGFAKTTGHDLTLLRRLSEFRTLAQPLLVGTSRKKFIGRITGESIPSDRLSGTAATIAWAVANGADILRVHDVAAMIRVTRMTRAILDSPDK